MRKNPQPWAHLAGGGVVARNQAMKLADGSAGTVLGVDQARGVVVVAVAGGRREVPLARVERVGTGRVRENPPTRSRRRPKVRVSRKLGRLVPAFRFFATHAGGVVGRNAQTALELAKAEALAEKAGWVVSWEPDADADWSWMSDAEKKKDHDVEVATIRNSRGVVLGSLGGIFDADRNYRRVVGAELALEALATTKRRVREKLGMAPAANPPKAKGVVLSRRVLEIRYLHAQTKRPRPYRHPFGRDVVAIAQADGSLLLRHAKGKRLHALFEVSDRL